MKYSAGIEPIEAPRCRMRRPIVESSGSSRRRSQAASMCGMASSPSYVCSTLQQPWFSPTIVAESFSWSSWA